MVTHFWPPTVAGQHWGDYAESGFSDGAGKRQVPRFRKECVLGRMKSTFINNKTVCRITHNSNQQQQQQHEQQHRVFGGVAATAAD